MNRKSLASRCGAAGKKAGAVFTIIFFKQLEHTFIVKIGVVVMHPQGIASVVENHVCRDPFAKVGLKANNTLLHKGAKLILEPLKKSQTRTVKSEKAAPLSKRGMFTKAIYSQPKTSVSKVKRS